MVKGRIIQGGGILGHDSLQPTGSKSRDLWQKKSWHRTLTPCTYGLVYSNQGPFLKGSIGSPNKVTSWSPSVLTQESVWDILHPDYNEHINIGNYNLFLTSVIFFYLTPELMQRLFREVFTQTSFRWGNPECTKILFCHPALCVF